MGSSGTGSGALQPTWEGFVGSTGDALILFEACLQGLLPHVPRRPHDRERNTLIRSGSIFIYEENASGIKRWTDGVAWSPSRILGNFLIYRELMQPFPPGEKKRATKRSKRSQTTRPGEPYPRRESDESRKDDSPTTPATAPSTPMIKQDASAPMTTPNRDLEIERQLIGSLVDSYGFKTDGLVKKTMSVTVSGVHHHLVSYYKVEDILNHRLQRPTTTQEARLRSIMPRPELVLRQNFRSPMDEMEETVDSQLDPRRNPAALNYYGDRRPAMYISQPVYYPQQPGMAPQQAYYQGMPGPALGPPYSGQQQYAGASNYALTTMPSPQHAYLNQPAASPQVGAEVYHSYPTMPYGAPYDPTNRPVRPVSSVPPSHGQNLPQPQLQQQQPHQQQPALQQQLPHQQQPALQPLQYPQQSIKPESPALNQNGNTNSSTREQYYSPPTMPHHSGYQSMPPRWQPHGLHEQPSSYHDSREWSHHNNAPDGIDRSQHAGQIQGWGAAS